MAVVEISRIQVRRGQENQSGVPVLAGGEFGWAADTENLYIGLRREDGGSRDGNVRVLTENDLRNLFQVIDTNNALSTSTYIYRNGTNITKPVGAGTEVARTIQDRLDDFVDVLAFGADPTGATASTQQIQLAINNLFLNSLGLTNTQKVLYFPKGIYTINGTIYIPRYTTIIGEGIGKTIINQQANACFFQTVDLRSTAPTYITFDNNGPMNSVNSPDYIQIEKLTLQHNSAGITSPIGTGFISLDCSSNSVIRDVRFKGCYVSTTASTSTYVGVNIRGYSALTSENITIDNCQFENIYYGIKSNYDILNPVINNSKFDGVNRGVVFCDPIDPTSVVGPRYARILNSRFKNTVREAIFVGTATSTATSHISMNNQFINVGNNSTDPGPGESSATGTAVIRYAANGNISVNDYFDRAAWQQTATGRLKKIIDGSAVVDSVAVTTVALSSLTVTVLQIPITGNDQFLNIRYNISSESRKGVLKINIDSGADPFVSITDEYNYSEFGGADGGIIWKAKVSSLTNSIKIEADNGSGQTLSYQTNLLLS